MAEAVDGAAPRADERRRDAVLLKEGDDAIDGVALRDAAEIELDAWRIETNRARRSVQHDVTIADAAHDVAQLGIGRHAAVAFEESPRFHQRTDGDVEGAVRVAAVVERSRDEIEKLLIDRRPAPAAASRLSCDRGL